MRPGSVSRQSGRAAGQSGEPGHQFQRTSAGPQPGYLAPSVLPRAKVLVSLCPVATAKPWTCTWRKSPITSSPVRVPVLLLDQAGWHGSAALIVPENIILMRLPPRCPELNPVENIWPFMRDNWLSNRIFKSYDDIVDHCCFAWNSLVDQPWRIMSLGLRQWAYSS